MFCFGTPYLPCSEEAELRRDQERHSQSIDAEIKRDMDEYRATHRLLLLGKLVLYDAPQHQYYAPLL